MFCTKCGKKIDYNATVCNECANGNTFFNDEKNISDMSYINYQNQYNAPASEPMEVANRSKESRTAGMGGAIGSIIFGLFGSIFCFYLMCFAPSLVILWDNGFGLSAMWEFIPFFMLGIIFIMVSLINSLRALHIYKKATIKPSVTRALGRVGLGFSITGICFIAASVLITVVALCVK